MGVLASFAAAATSIHALENRDFQGCGLYKIYGTLRLKDLKPELQVFEGSENDYSIELQLGEPNQVIPYLEQYLEVEAQILDPMPSHTSVVKPVRLKKIYYTADQLEHVGFTKLKTLSCKSKP
jgi:hypothetical protein